MTATRAALRWLDVAAMGAVLAALSCSSGGAGPATGAGGATGAAGAPATGNAGNTGNAGGGGTTGAAGSGGVAGTSGGGGATGGAGATGTAGATGGAGATGAAGTSGAGGATDGGSTDASATEAGGALTLMSSAFAEGATIPNTYTCAGGTDMHMTPPLAWTGQPAGTKGYAIVLKDTTNMFTHWAIWDIPATTMALAMGLPVNTHMLTDPAGAKQVGGNNQSMGYISPCPPAGSTHTYIFTLYAQSALPLANVMTTQTADAIATQLGKQNVGSTMLTSKVTH